ncbi:uncharacterized protein NKAPD1 [Aplochiton taeniatus]
MSRVPVGKVLLRNVIRHTDAHNKIQEESEMWKLRVMEKQVPQPAQIHQTRGHMHCDRVEDDSRDRSRSHNHTSAEDEKESRYWKRKLYEFEAKDPDRWGHSGFKELYPEEFNSDGEKGKKKYISKHRKKSSKKKKKRKEEKRKKDEEQSSDNSSDDSDNNRCQQRRKRTKSKHKRKKSERGREEGNSSANSKMEGGSGKRTSSHRKRHIDPDKGSDSGLESIKRRKNRKATKEDESGDRSEN